MDIPRETPNRAHKTRDGITISQTGPDIRTASTGRPEGGKLASGFGVFSPFSCPFFSYLKRVSSPVLTTTLQPKTLLYCSPKFLNTLVIL